MKRSLILIPIWAILLTAGPALAQEEDLLEELEQEVQEDEDVIATFKTTRIVNGQSVEGAKRNVLQVVILHRFSELDEGIETFFGLDDANIMLNLEYGIADNLQVGLQRSSFNKLVDGYAKYRFLNQTMDDRIPLSAALYVESSVNTTKFPDDAPVRPSGKHRWAHTSQLLLARKFGERFSAQLTPTYVHRNLVPLTADENDTYALGAGASIKLTKGVSLNLEYFYRFNEDQTESYDPIAIGVDIETGGHVFQLHFTNARQMSARGYMTETTGDFFEGGIHFGFNLNRVFQLDGKKKK